MNITKGKIKKILKKSNKKQTNKIKKKVHFRKKKINNRSLKKRNNKVNLRVKTLKYGGEKHEEIFNPLMNQKNLDNLVPNKGSDAEKEKLKLEAEKIMTEQQKKKERENKINIEKEQREPLLKSQSSQLK